jgi:hypothetical protein
VLTTQETLVASNAIREFRVALSNLFLYSADNHMVDQSLERFLQALGLLFEAREEVTLGMSEGRLVVEGTGLDEHVTGSTNMLRDLFMTHELHSLTFKKGLRLEELKAFGMFLKPKALFPGTSHPERQHAPCGGQPQGVRGDGGRQCGFPGDGQGKGRW